jgi:hypothetical protein
MYVMAIDTAGARALGDELLASSARADDLHGQVLAVMSQSELPTDAATRLAAGRDALRTLGTAVVDKADLAESFSVDPAGTAAALGAPEADLGSAVTALLGFAGTRSLRDVLAGLPPPGADPALDAAVARLTPTLLPALLAGERPELTADSHADLRTLALALGITAAGPRVAAPAEDEPSSGREGVFRVLGEKLSSDSTIRRLFDRGTAKGGTEVFHHDFWTDGRTPQEVLDDPEQLLTWVSETFQLDRRLTLATEVPGLVDILQTHDFAKSADTTVDQLVAEVAGSFAAVEQYLPALLSGAAVPPPDAVQAEQIVAFATRVGWVDTTAGTVDARLADAVAYLSANRFLAGALLPSAFEANGVALPFFDATGIGLTLDLGVRRGLVDDALVAGLGATVDAVAARLGVDLAGATPPLVDEAFEKEFLTPLVAAQIGAQGAASASIGLAFRQVLPFLRGAASGPQLRDRLVEALAALRTLAVVGVPAFTERQLTAIVGDRVVDVLGRARLRRRDASFTKERPEFLALAAQWGIPGGDKIKTEKHKFTFSFDETGVLTAIRRKKRSTWSKISDAVKGIVKGIGDAFEENPLKAIFEVGKIALGVGALLFPGTQALGIAAIATNAVGAVASAIEGDWLGALSSGLGAFTGGIGLGGFTDAISLAQATVLDGLIDPTTLNLLKVAKSGVDAARAVTTAIEAESPLAALTAGAQALSSGLGGLGLATGDAALRNLSATFADLQPVIGGVGGTIAAFDQGNLLAAIGNGLGTLAAGARALGNPLGVSGLFGFDAATSQDLLALARTTGVAGSLANAVSAADRGELAATASFLLQALDHAEADPVLGVNIPKIATEIADLGAILERAVEAGVSSPALAGPVLAQLGKIGASLNPRVENTPVPPLPTRRPAEARAGVPAPSVEGRPLTELLGGALPTSPLEALLLVRGVGAAAPVAPPSPAPSPVGGEISDPVERKLIDPVTGLVPPDPPPLGFDPFAPVTAEDLALLARDRERLLDILGATPVLAAPGPAGAGPGIDDPGFLDARLLFDPTSVASERLLGGEGNQTLTDDLLFASALDPARLPSVSFGPVLPAGFDIDAARSAPVFVSDVRPVLADADTSVGGSDLTLTLAGLAKDIAGELLVLPGLAVDVAEATNGRDLVTGEPLSLPERGLIFAPFLGTLIKGARRADTISDGLAEVTADGARRFTSRLDPAAADVANRLEGLVPGSVVRVNALVMKADGTPLTDLDVILGDPATGRPLAVLEVKSRGFNTQDFAPDEPGRTGQINRLREATPLPVILLSEGTTDNRADRVRAAGVPVVRRLEDLPGVIASLARQ